MAEVKILQALVNQTYELVAASADDASRAAHAEFTVQVEPVRVDLTLERSSAEVTLVFRAQVPQQFAGQLDDTKFIIIWCVRSRRRANRRSR